MERSTPEQDVITVMPVDMVADGCGFDDALRFAETTQRLDAELVSSDSDPPCHSVPAPPFLLVTSPVVLFALLLSVASSWWS